MAEPADKNQDPTGARIGEQLAAERNGYRQRVKDEHAEAVERVQRLESFINGPQYYSVHDDEKGMLLTQLQQMKAYVATIKQRIQFHATQT